MLQVSPAVHDPHDFYLIDYALVPIGMGLVKDQIGAFNEHSRGPANLWTAYAKARVSDQQFCLRHHCIEDAFRGCWIVKTDVDINLDQILTGLRSPDKINWQGLVLPLQLPAAVAPRAEPLQSPLA